MFDKALKVVQKGIQTIVSNINGVSGSKITVNGKTYIEERLIAEGAFGYIYLVSDPSSSTQYALKRINITGKEQLKLIQSEIEVWNRINKSKFIIKLIDYEITQTVAFILMEHAPEGTLFDFISKREKSLSENEALNILYQMTSGLSYMHRQTPPIAHRDIKIENVLKCGAVFKLCDFGSASSFVLDPSKEDKKIVQMQFAQFEKFSTFIYRPPEMCDVYCNYIVNEKVDIWALGCVFYAMLFKRHPFQDAQKLTIISGQYQVPDYGENYSEKLIDLMRLLLTSNPMNRPNCSYLIDLLKNWKTVNQIELNEEVMKIKAMQKSIVFKAEIDDFFFSNQGKVESKSNGADNNVSEKKQEIWDFDFGKQTTQSQLQVQSQGNYNLLDFDNGESSKASNSTPSDVGNGNVQGKQVNLLNDFDFDTTATFNTNNPHSNINQKNESNHLYGIDFNCYSNPEPMFTSNNNTHSNQGNSQPSQKTFKTKKNATPPQVNHQTENQDILSFF